MKKLLILITLLLSVNIAYGQDECFKDSIAGYDVYICSVKNNNTNTSLLISDKKEVMEYSKEVNPKGYIENKQNVMVIKKGANNILVDTGFPDTVDNLKSTLLSLGLTFDKITHVVLTHGHYDHIGGMIVNDNATFSNATIYIDKKDYDYFHDSDITKADDNLKRNVENFRKTFGQYKGKIKFFNKGIIDKSIKNIKAVPAYGHTPGHNLINISDKKKDLLFVADLFHVYNVQMKYPDTAMVFDVDKAEAIKSRQNVLNKYKGTSTLIVGAHTPFYTPINWVK